MACTVRLNGLNVVRFALIGHPRSDAHLVQELACPPSSGDGHDAEKHALDLARETVPFVTDFVPGYAATPERLISGIHVGVPITPALIRAAPRLAVAKIDQAVSAAARAGADVVALGGLTSALFRTGASAAAVREKVVITSGSALTIASTIRSVRAWGQLRNLDLRDASVAVIGASGEIGSGCCRMLCGDVGRLALVGRNREKLEALGRTLDRRSTTIQTRHSNDLDLRSFEIVVFATNAATLSIEPWGIETGTLVCDVGYPPDVNVRSVGVRGDVEVIRGGLMRLPRPLRVSVDLSIGDPSIVFGCFAEAMVLAHGASLTPRAVPAFPDRSQIDAIYDEALRFGFSAAAIPHDRADAQAPEARTAPGRSLAADGAVAGTG